MNGETLTDFGFARVPPSEKTRRVGEVFTRAAGKYDLMNDVMSLGLHRVYKRMAASLLLARPGMRVLDVAGGSGDMSVLLAPRVVPGGGVWLADSNAAMLSLAAVKTAKNESAVTTVRCDAENLPFAEGFFDRAIIAFGLRNITAKQRALSELARVLRPGGIAAVLEFAPPSASLCAASYRAYLEALPFIGRVVAGDAESYRYLAQSVARHPPPDEIAAMMLGAGFADADIFNLCGGMLALHRARR